MKARAHLYISGRVQGVNFRWFTRDVADVLGLCGWVRNLPDGRVEAVFEGDREVIDQAILKCKQGSPASHVTGVELIWENQFQGFDDFELRH